MKNPLTPAGIEPTTFRFVAQHLNHCATAVPTTKVVKEKKLCVAQEVTQTLCAMQLLSHRVLFNVSNIKLSTCFKQKLSGTEKKCSSSKTLEFHYKSV